MENTEGEPRWMERAKEVGYLWQRRVREEQV